MNLCVCVRVEGWEAIRNILKGSGIEKKVGQTKLKKGEVP